MKTKDCFQDLFSPPGNLILNLYSIAPHITLKDLLRTLRNIDKNPLDLTEPVLIKTVLFDSNSFDTNTNANILNATIKYDLSIK